MVISKTLYYKEIFTLTSIKELTYGGIDQAGVMEWKKLIELVQSKVLV